jgi:hypothetical protein
MIVADGESLSRVSGGRWTTLVDLSDFTRSNLFVPGGVAVAANGAVYTDSSYGDGFTSGAGLGEVLPSGKFELLNSWKSHCAGPGLC